MVSEIEIPIIDKEHKITLESKGILKVNVRNLHRKQISSFKVKWKGILGESFKVKWKGILGEEAIWELKEFMHKYPNL